MSELQLHRAAISYVSGLVHWPSWVELGRVFFELILCIVIIVLAFAKCFPKPNEPNDPDDDWHMLKTSSVFHLRSCYHIKHSSATDLKHIKMCGDCKKKRKTK